MSNNYIIVVIGDSMLDINNNCSSNKTAPECDTVPIYKIQETEYILGGAANVANNLHNLGCDIEFISTCGDDFNGNILRTMLNDKNIKNSMFVSPLLSSCNEKKRKTTTKTRFFIDERLVARCDDEDLFEIDSQLTNDVFNYIKSLSNIRAILISDYGKGFITKELCENIIKYSNLNNILTFVDPKTRDDPIKYKNCYCFKPNLIEAIDIYYKFNNFV